MIDIKATKAQAPSNEPSRDRYLQKAGAVLGKMPVHLALILTAAVLYLQSFIRNAAAQGDAPGEGHPAPPEPAAGSIGAQQTDAVNGAQDEQPPAMADRTSIGATIRSEASSFVMLDSPAIDFAVSPVAVRTSKEAFEFRPKSSNDNIGSAVHGHGSPAGSGGAAFQGGREHADRSGGGGGEGEDQEEDDVDDDDTPVPNRAPRTNGSVLLGDFVSGQAAFITFAALLQNASDPDGDSLAIGDVQASSGTLVPVQGGWIYTAAAGQTGLQSITYTIHDAAYAIPQIARFQVVAQPAAEAAAMSDAAFAALPTGDEAADSGDQDPLLSSNSAVRREAPRLPEVDAEVLYGTASDDTILGGSGDEVVFGRRGNDVVRAGAGDDRLFGEDGDDVLFGEDGDDLLAGGDGNDKLDGGAGADDVRGEGGDDVLVASLDADADLYDGGGGTDTLDLSETKAGTCVDLTAGTADGVETGADLVTGIEQVTGGAGADDLRGNAGANVLSGAAGDDILDGCGGQDEVHGGDGNDRLVGSSDAVADILDGGSGTDTLDLSGTSLGVLVDLTTGKAVGVEIGEDLLSEIENILGGAGDDTFIVATQSAELCGGGGNDEFRFTALAVAPTAHVIHDFMVGDRIYIADYEISKQAADEVATLFEDIYGNREEHRGRSIRYHNERVDEMDRTRIEADLDGDALYELAISLDGHHVLFIAENIT